jgi:CRP-like cAMP-binding protein
LALDDTIGLLAQAPIVGLFEQDALKLLAFSAETRRLRPGEALFKRGDRSDGGYVVIQGRIAVSSAPDGSQPVLLGPSSLIGRLALFVRMQRPAGAVALEAAEVVRISPTLMRRVLAEFPSAADAMHAEIAADLADLSADLARVRQRFLDPEKR